MQLAPEVIRLAAMQCSFQKETDDRTVAHLQETPVRAVYSAADDAKTSVLNLSRELIILGIQCFFVKAADLIESGFVHQHEHPGCKRFVKSRQTLGYVIKCIQKAVLPSAVAAENVRGDTM